MADQDRAGGGAADLPLMKAEMVVEWHRYDGPLAGLCRVGDRTLFFDVDHHAEEPIYPHDEEGIDMPRMYLLYAEWDDLTFEAKGEPLGWCSEEDFRG